MTTPHLFLISMTGMLTLTGCGITPPSAGPQQEESDMTDNMDVANEVMDEAMSEDEAMVMDDMMPVDVNDAIGLETATFIDLETGAPLEESTGTLIRFANRIEWTLEASDLDPGHVYTVWYTIINNPQICAARPCQGSDFANRDLIVSGLLPVGGVADGDGVVTISATTMSGDMEAAAFGPGLTAPDVAELSLILRSHGPAITDDLDTQLNSLDGGCPPNDCADIQLIMFAP